MPMCVAASSEALAWLTKASQKKNKSRVFYLPIYRTSETLSVSVSST